MIQDTRKENTVKFREPKHIPVVYYRDEWKYVPTTIKYMAKPKAELFRETAKKNLTATPADFLSEARKLVATHLQEQVQIS